MSLKVVAATSVLVVVTAIVSYKLAASMTRIGERSSIASPTEMMLRVIVEEMKAGNQEQAKRMTEALQRGLHEHLYGRGPTPEKFIGEVYAAGGK